MKRMLVWSLQAILAATVLGAEPWQRMSDPGTAEVARLFRSPPPAAPPMFAGTE